MFRLSCMMKSNDRTTKKFLCEILIAPVGNINTPLIIILCEPFILFTLHNHMSIVNHKKYFLHNRLIPQKEKPCTRTAFSISKSEFIFHSCQEVAS